jgi:hydrogenase/urease accessory protein HupE
MFSTSRGVSRLVRPAGGGAACVLCAAALVLSMARGAAAHPAPFSYLDLRVSSGGLEGTLVVHVVDLAHDLAFDVPNRLLDAAYVTREAPRLCALITARIGLVTGAGEVHPACDAAVAMPDRQAVRFDLRFAGDPPAALVRIRARLFPYDPNHQTFVNVYEQGALAHQAILDADRPSADYYRGTVQGRLALVERFVLEGVRHIVIGPDHVLFLIGLLLLGGSLSQLVRIVTAFTLAHSVTLSIAALGLVSPSARLVEPAIALSIVYVGADNLLVSKSGRDVRAWIAFAFGLVHGFGFAGVLAELGLPRSALGWSLFSFNVGVEIGQVCIVVVVASAFAVLRRRSEVSGRLLVPVGSAAVIAAGAFWFVERVFFPGGV